mmetsp:Transcript_9181/g.27631  ORF Transcript_9181/g.27631 Transcript_9181/m.27631 type:complete len:424 (-) Transcript_9181:740-2011(-)
MRIAIGTGGRVAVVGAGAGGLCSAKNLKEFGRDFQVTVFEAEEIVGGTWNYTDKIGSRSSMYKSLRTNLPKQIMAFPGFPFDDSLPSFPHHESIAEYLRDYAKRHAILPLIRFNTEVKRIWRDEQSNSWRIRSHTKSESGEAEEEFDAVMLCNGHYSDPSVPALPGLDTFRGEVHHSHYYKEPSPYRDSVIVVLGAGPSGIDIAYELATVAKSVVLSHRGHETDQGLVPNLVQRPAIKCVNGDEVEFEDGRKIRADHIMFCTGYEYTFPFLDPKLGVRVVDNHVEGLFRHLIYMRQPTLSFIQLPFKIVPFPMIYYQTRYVSALLAGDTELPSEEEMEAEARQEAEIQSSRPPRHYHLLGNRQWEYNRKLAAEAGAEPLPKAIEEIYDEAAKARKANPLKYRHREYTVFGDSEHEWRVANAGA